MKATDIKPAKNIFGLFVGKSGSGKDCAAFSYPTPTKVFDLDLRAEGGALGTTWLSHEHKSQIDITRVYPGTSFKKIEDELVSLKLQFSRGMIPFNTIYFGSVTSLSGLLMSEAGTLIEGLKKGVIRLSGPADYKYLYAAMKDFLDYIRVFPVNVILSAHIVDRYAKPETGGDDKNYAEPIVVGERLTLTDKLSENIQIYFNEVYRFEKRMQGDKPKHYVRFRTDLAKTVYQSLPNGEVDITNTNFYEKWKGYIEKETVKAV